MWKNPISGTPSRTQGEIRERRLLDHVIMTLRSKLPPSWSAESTTWLTTPDAAKPGRSADADAVVTVTAPDGTSEQVIVEVKHRLEPKWCIRQVRGRIWEPPVRGASHGASCPRPHC